MSTIYFDVTQLVHRPGLLTGIPRVMDELAKRFAVDGAVFVSWVKDLELFCAVDLEASLQNRGHGVVYQTRATGSNDAAATTVSSSVLKRGAKKVARKGLHATAKVSPSLAEKLHRKSGQLQAQNYQVADFQANDILLVPWGEWWDETFTSQLETWHLERSVCLVQIVHDMATTTQAQFFEQVAVSPTDYNRRILPICSLVLAVSQNTKREMVDWLKSENLSVPPVAVFREGDDFQFSVAKKPTEPVFTKSGLKGNDFLLCVGTIEAKKNHFLFYYVYKLAQARGIKLPKLVMVGRLGYGTEMAYKAMTNDQTVRDSFVFMHNTNDEELAWLYEHCLFTVLPSFHEGWGIPIAESLARGVPCLCSNTSSMVEIAPGITKHFDPSSADECLSGIQAWLDPKSLKSARGAAKKYKMFSWDESYTQVKKALENLHE